MSDEKQPPERELVREERQEMAGYTRTVRYYRKRCPVCGEEFVGPARQIYNKPSCRQTAWDREHPENRKARKARYDAKRAARKRAAGQKAAGDA